MKIQTLLIATLATVFANAQEKPADPYKGGSAGPANPVAAPSPDLSVCYEDFSLPLAMAAALQREQLTDATLYEKVLAAVGKDSVRQETFAVLRVRSAQKATNESITEMIYPTEFSEARLSNAVTLGTGSKEDPTTVLAVPGPVAIARTPATPTAFDTRNVGFTFEVEPTLSADGNFVEMRMVPEHVTFVGRVSWGQEFSTAEMPTFETQRLNMAFTAKLNAPYLLGTMNRPLGSKQDPDSANRVWFAFVTTKLTK